MKVSLNDKILLLATLHVISGMLPLRDVIHGVFIRLDLQILVGQWYVGSVRTEELTTKN